MKRLALLLFCAVLANAQSTKAIEDQIKTLRSLDDTTRARVTRQLAGEINRVGTKDRLPLASSLANLSTEGDFGRDTLQFVTTMLESAVKLYPPANTKDGPAYPYFQLARLSVYENMNVLLKDPRFDEAVATLRKDDAARNGADFTLTDLNGQKWTLLAFEARLCW